MKMIIDNIKFCNNEFKEIKKLAEYLTNRLNSWEIKCNIKLNKNNIIFSEIEKKLFKSSRINFIKLKEGDGRILKNGRNYLESERLTKEQFEKVLKTFSQHIDQIGISCDIKMYPDSDNENKVIEIRKDLCNYIYNWPKPDSFPVERI